MNTVIISPKYQVVIPKEIRKSAGLKPGQKVKLINYDNRIEIIPLEDIKKMRGILKGINTEIVREKDRF
ncbi:MAG: AbrB/MazE/SpoVT family DNA-binding domain-containing protein [FCB group bacterium]|jgi:AbrB family looped-hinge helix DNA binding protein